MTGFGFLLAWVMAAGALSYTALSVLSTFLIDEFAISRSSFGVLVAVLGLVGMISAPGVGALTDSRGGVFALRLLLGITAVGFAAIAIAPTYSLMVVAVMLSGIGSTSGNPITNNLIASYIPDGTRGLMVGVKHSGGQLGVLAASLALPGLAIAFGWRASVALMLVVPLIGVAISKLAEPGLEIVDLEAVGRGHRPHKWRLIANAGLMGLGTSAVVAFLPLYGHQRLGMSVTRASALIGLIAGFAIVSRFLWGWYGDRFRVVTTPLLLIAVTSVLSTMSIALSPAVGIPILWVGAALAGIGTMAWHAAGMLVVLHGANSHNSAKATAAVHVGFLGGWTIGPVAFGFAVDQASYLTAWLGLVIVFCLAAIVVVGANTARTESASIEGRT